MFLYLIFSSLGCIKPCMAINVCGTLTAVSHFSPVPSVRFAMPVDIYFGHLKVTDGKTCGAPGVGHPNLSSPEEQTRQSTHALIAGNITHCALIYRLFE